MMLPRFRPAVGAAAFIAGAALANVALYHAPLLGFAARNLDLQSTGGALTLATVLVALLASTATLLGLLALVSPRLLKPLCALFASGNAVALYFVATYGVVLDKTMIGNVVDTDLAEALELLHPGLLAYVALLGVAPALLLSRVTIRPTARPRLAAATLACVALTLAWAWLASSTWLWFDHHARKLGGMVLPWSYVVNAGRALAPRLWHAEQVPLPPATFESDDKTVVMLVIGEAARRRNFALYGYARPTTPELARAGAVALAGTTACSTYTTASVRCILSHADSGSEFATRHEPLPSYLQRHGVDVLWRTRNWGEPELEVGSFERGRDLAAGCAGDGCAHDEVLLAGLAERIRASKSRKVLVVLHQMGSHGPAYSKRYPPAFERFTPVCRSVELSQCTPAELLNAYDNTILYTDHVLARAIDTLRSLERTATLLAYVADHGESLGEYGLYLHGTPAAIAPDVQKEVPFVVWMSPEFERTRGVDARRLAAQPRHSQRDVFHSVMGAFAMRSAAYDARYDLFSEAFAEP